MRVGRQRLGIVSAYPPRRSGLAEYCGDLVRALGSSVDPVVCAVDRHGLDYPDEVVAVIGADAADDYRRAARILAEHRVDAVLIQHDENVFAGPDGSHVLELARELRLRRVPYLVTLHGMQPGGDPASARTLEGLVRGAAGVVVTSDGARRRLAAWGVVDAGKVRVVPLGVPAPGAMPAGTPVRPALLEALAGPGPVLSTFGGVEPGKGIETALVALPAIAAHCPDVRYIVAGTSGGEAYGEELRRLVADRGLARLVRFVDAYLSPAEIVRLLGRTDVYLAPDLPVGRAASGSLTRAVAAGCPTVAGTHPYALELLGDARPPAGVVVPAGDADALAAAVTALLTDPARAAALRSAAAAVGRRHHWDVVAGQIVGLVGRAVRLQARSGTNGGTVAQLRLDALAPGAGVVVAPAGTAWDAHRAVVSAELLALPQAALPPGGWTAAADWLERSLARLGHASQDDAGIALWGLGRAAAGPGVPEPLREAADLLCAVRLHELPTEPGPAAYAALGLARAPGREEPLARVAAHVDAARLRAGRGLAWPWFTDRLGGDAARLPQALIAAGRRLLDVTMVRRGLASLDWYACRVGLDGADGVLRLPGESAHDAAALVEALVEAYAATGSSHYARLAQRAFAWFMGANRNGQLVYDAELGRCHASIRGGIGLGDTGAGSRPPDDALATLAYLGATLSLVAARLADLPVAHRDLAST